MATILERAGITPAKPVDVNAENLWRLETNGESKTWARSPYPDAASKYFIVSCDTHLSVPGNLFAERVDAKYRDRLPRIEVDAEGNKWTIAMDGARRDRVHEMPMEGEDKYRTSAGSARGIQKGVVDESNIHQRIADQIADGIDGEVVFPNGPGQFVFGTHDHDLTLALSQAYNDWCWELCSPYTYFCNPTAAIPTINVENAVAEIQRVAKLGYRVLTLPSKPMFGPPDVAHPNYNLPMYDPMWAAIQDTDLAFTFHVSSGRDPRTSRGNGGAVVNYVIGSLLPNIEPMANICASGVLDRFPKLRFALIETGIGWLPWALDAMDEAYTKHHFWVRPKLKHGLPSDYFRTSGASTFGEDPSGLALLESYRLTENALWANDYPHHEGTWPHSAQAIERQMGALQEETRAKVLGLNAAKMFKFDIPAQFSV